MPAARSHVPPQAHLRLGPPAHAVGRTDDSQWQVALEIGGDTVAWVYPAGDPVHAHQARTWIGAYLATVWNEPDAIFSAEIVSSELLANASIHGTGLVTVAARADTHILLLEVGDDSPRLPAPHTSEDDDEDGRGLQIVDALAERWRVLPRLGGGKTVQVMLAASPLRACSENTSAEPLIATAEPAKHQLS